MDEYCNKCNKQVKFDIDEHIVYRCPECHKEQEDDTSVKKKIISNEEAKGIFAGIFIMLFTIIILTIITLWRN